MIAYLILWIITFAALVAALGYIWWLHRVIDSMSGSHARPRERGAADAALPDGAAPAPSPGAAPASVPPLTGMPTVARETAEAEPAPDSLEWHAETAAAEHANNMWQASKPYLPPPPIRLGQAPTRPDVPGHPPWTGSQPALTEAMIIERDRQRFIRAELEALGDDPTESGVGRVMLMARALPASGAAVPEIVLGVRP